MNPMSILRLVVGSCGSRLFALTLPALVLITLHATPSAAQIAPVGPTKSLVNTNPLPLIGNDVAYDPANKIYLSVIGHGDVWGAFSTESGDLISSFRIGSTNRNSPYGQHPRCIYSPELNGGRGGFLVTWHQNDGLPNFVHSVVVAYPAGVISADTVISGDFQGGSFATSGPALAYSPASHRFFVAWTTRLWGTQGRFVDAATGAPIGAIMQLVDASSTGGSSHPALTWNSATDEFGLAYAGWNSTSAFVGFRRVRASDGLMSAPTSFGFGPGTFSPGITVNPATQQYLIGWSVGAGSRAVAFDRSGTMLGTGHLLTTQVGTPASFSLAFNSVSGTGLAVSEGTASFEVTGVEFDGAGVPIGVASALTSSSTSNWIPRVTASTDAKEWNISSSRHKVTLANQIVTTSSTGTPASGVGPAPSPTPISPAAAKGDFSADGKPDLLWQRDDGYLSAWKMNGTTLVEAVLLDPGRISDVGWQMVGTGDLNGDGKPEIIWQHMTKGLVAAWFMNGTALAHSVLLNPDTVSTAWQVVAVADMNGDRKADLIWQRNDGLLAIWFMDGSTAGNQQLLNPSSITGPWRIVGAGDFNGDGKNDLVWQHTSGWLSAWYMDGATMLDAVYLNPSFISGDHWKVNGVSDVNGDGKPDLLWRHTAGWLSAWLMNGVIAIDAIYFEPNVVDSRWRLAGPR